MNDIPSKDLLEEFLSNNNDNDRSFSATANYSSPSQLARYALLKLGSSLAVYPFEMVRLLRQLQNSNVQTVQEKSFAFKPSILLTQKWPLLLNKRGDLFLIRSVQKTASTQGFFSLWQGLGAFWLHSVLFDFGRAAVEEMAGWMLGGCEAEEDSTGWSPLLVPVLAEASVALALAPLETAHTRLAVQSIWPGEQRYRGIWSALGTSCSNGFFVALSYLLPPLMRILPLNWCMRRIVREEEIGIFSPTILYYVVQYALLNVQLLVTLPLETVRRRLQIDAEDSQLFISRVPLSTVPYQSGVLDCARRMVKEEGWASLYQGWAVQVVNNSLLLLLNLLMEIEDYYPEDLEGFF